MKKLIYSALLASLLLTGCGSRTSGTYNIEDFGAKGDSLTLNTEAIQRCIDRASSDGGGVVVVPRGIFITGTVFLKSNVTLRLETGAKILGSENIDDYAEMTWGHNADRQPYHLIAAYDQQNIALEGDGVIDGNGRFFWQDYEKDADGRMVTPRWLLPKDKKVSPLIEIVRCKDVNIHGNEIHTGGGWNIHVHDCDNVKISEVDIINNIFSPNSDGIDITGCHDVIVSDCYIKTCDDAICLKTVPDSRDCRRVTITNCIVETLCVGIKMGCVESFKDMSDVTVSNCVINKSSRAIGIYLKEEAEYKNITINNIVSNTNAPLAFNRPIAIQCERVDSTKGFGAIRNVLISNFISETEGRILMTAQEGCTLENVVLRDIILTYPFIEDPTPMVPEARSAQFPKPAWHPGVGGALAAIVANNIDNLIVDNVIINWPATDTIPEQWKYPERIENGSPRIHRYDYSHARQTELKVLWGRNLRGGYIDVPLAVSSDGSSKFDISTSTIKY